MWEISCLFAVLWCIPAQKNSLFITSVIKMYRVKMNVVFEENFRSHFLTQQLKFLKHRAIFSELSMEGFEITHKDHFVKVLQSKLSLAKQRQCGNGDCNLGSKFRWGVNVISSVIPWKGLNCRQNWPGTQNEMITYRCINKGWLFFLAVYNDADSEAVLGAAVQQVGSRWRCCSSHRSAALLTLCPPPS